MRLFWTTITAILAVLFGLAIVAHAAPFLVCDPSTDAESYVLILNDGAEIETPAPLHYDLSSLSPGTHVVKAYAVKGVWRSEASVPLEFTKPELLKPVIRIE